jgi:hypothetical protein
MQSISGIPEALRPRTAAVDAVELRVEAPLFVRADWVV